MANRSHYITPEPVDLKQVAGLALVEGTDYRLQNRSNHTLYYAELAEAPDPATTEDENAFDPAASGTLTLTATPFWMWVDPGKTARIVINEAPV